jgi:hypothetical protein
LNGFDGLVSATTVKLSLTVSPTSRGATHSTHPTHPAALLTYMQSEPWGESAPACALHPNSSAAKLALPSSWTGRTHNRVCAVARHDRTSARQAGFGVLASSEGTSASARSGRRRSDDTTLSDLGITTGRATRPVLGRSDATTDQPSAQISTCTARGLKLRRVCALGRVVRPFTLVAVGK